MSGPRERRLGRWLLGGAGAAFLAVLSPAVARAGPLADDFHLCLVRLESGYGPYLRGIWQEYGIVRPARMIEVGLMSTLCPHVPFGVLTLVPLVLTVLTGLALVVLLDDLGVPAPWPFVAGAAWFLQPLGTEAALWPAALHVSLGLLLALVGLRLLHRGQLGWAAVAIAGAYVSVEHLLFALPLAAWLVARPQQRRRAALVTGGMAVAILALYAAFPGENPRQALTIAERLANVVADPQWYVLFPAVGLGLHSGYLALLWAFPLSVAVWGAGAVGGLWAGPALLSTERQSPGEGTGRLTVALAALLGLLSLPLVVTEVGYAGRTFTPLWLLLAAGIGLLGPRVAWRRQRVAGLVAGTFAAFALLSLALSVSVRVTTVAFDEASSHWLAAQVEDGDVVAVCDVRLTVTEPAPVGEFHWNTYQSESANALRYYTGTRAELRRGGEPWGPRCPDLTGADLVVDFDDLLEAAASARDSLGAGNGPP